MAAAIGFAVEIFHLGPWRLATRDVHAAYLASETDDDAFVFSYRAIEDLARAVSQDGNKDWSALHAVLGTSESLFKKRTLRLFLARNAVAHGDAADPDLAWARANRKRALNVSRRLVCEAAVAAGHAI